MQRKNIIYIIILITLTQLFISCNEKIKYSEDEKKLFVNEVFYDPPYVFGYIKIIREVKKHKLITIQSVKSKNTYVNIGANLFIYGSHYISEDININDLNNYIATNDTLEEYFNFFRIICKSQDTLYSKLYKHLGKSYGFDKIYEELTVGNNDFKIKNDKQSSILFGSWVELLNFYIVLYEEKKISKSDLLGIKNSLELLLYNYQNAYYSKTSEIYQKEIQDLIKLFDSAIIKEPSSYAENGKLLMTDYVYDESKILPIIIYIKELKGKYIGE